MIARQPMINQLCGKVPASMRKTLLGFRLNSVLSSQSETTDFEEQTEGYSFPGKLLIHQAWLEHCAVPQALFRQCENRATRDTRFWVGGPHGLMDGGGVTLHETGHMTQVSSEQMESSACSGRNASVPGGPWEAAIPSLRGSDPIKQPVTEGL